MSGQDHLGDFAEVHPSWVDRFDPHTRPLIDLAVSVAAKALDLSALEVCWVLPAEAFSGASVRATTWHRKPKTWRAWTDVQSPRRIYLRGDRPAADVMRSALHEIRHCWQWCQGDAFADDEVAERDANAWAEQAHALPVR